MAAKKKTTTKGKKTNQEDILIDMMKSYPLLRTDTDIFAKITRNGKACNLSLNSEEFLFFIKSEFKELTGSFPISTTMKDCIDYIKNLAYKNEVTEARYRIAPYEDSIIYDLCNGNCVKITPKGWTVDKNEYAFFVQSKDQLPQVAPIHCERGWERLYKYLNVSDEEKLLLTVYIVSCFNPNIVFPTISINGTKGSGKSTLSRIVKKIIDPSFSELEVIPDSLNNLRIRLNTCYYTAFDNLSKLSYKQSDFLCSVITGVSWTDRQYYTNKEIDCSHLQKSMCLNGISNFIFRDDFAERVLFFNTRLIRDKNRRGQNDIWDSFYEDLPYILGGIFDLVSLGLKLSPDIKIDEPIRLADFHKFAYAIAEAMGGKGKDFDKIIKTNKERQMEITCENSMLIQLLVDFLKECEGEWCSTMTALYKALKNYMSECDGDYRVEAFPKAANYLSAELKKHESALSSKGITLFIKKNSDGNSEISITTDWVIRKSIKIGREPIVFDVDEKRKILAQLIDESTADDVDN